MLEDQIKEAAQSMIDNAPRIAESMKSEHYRSLSLAIRRNLGRDKIDEVEFSAYDARDSGTIQTGSLDDSIILFEALSAFETESEANDDN